MDIPVIALVGTAAGYLTAGFVLVLLSISDAGKGEILSIRASVIDLAKRSHVSSKIIYAFEDGRCGLKIHTFLKLIEAFNITIEID